MVIIKAKTSVLKFEHGGFFMKNHLKNREFAYLYINIFYIKIITRNY